ncbi:hypothetical protein NDS46_12025 [Paenibacillus thiaminolyticus]|uniref:hypothetical protein n=1 Tax=Paenibacillus thiaminolyticus TaxID=49283 RepID=UPI00233023BC|nr:hypothetical protein [Paenibacillus thiaminolyticus]WCF10520.1 hypothetical protein NDS46_12025 [Paenibacillus thiaminolyticus]
MSQKNRISWNNFALRPHHLDAEEIGGIGPIGHAEGYRHRIGVRLVLGPGSGGIGLRPERNTVCCRAGPQRLPQADSAMQRSVN